MTSLSTPVKRPIAPALLGLITGSALLFAVSTVHQLTDRDRDEKARAQVADQVNVLKARFAESLGSKLHLAPHLASFIRTEFSPRGQIDANTEFEFGVLAEDFMRNQPGVIRLMVAKNGVILHVAPAAGNESLRGKNLYLEPVVGTLLKSGMTQDKPVVTFTRTKSGNRTLTLYVPVRVPQTSGGEDLLWGFTSVTIDFERVLTESGFFDESLKIDLAVATGDIDDPATTMILGERELFAKDPIFEELNLHGLKWIVAARPQAGWHGLSFGERWLLAGGAIVSIGAGLVIFILVGQVLGRSREAVQRSEARLRETFEQAAVGIAHLDGKRDWLRFNRKLGEILGYSDEELATETINTLTHPDDLPACLTEFQGLLEGESDTYSLEARHKKKDGDYLWINITMSVVLDTQGAPEYFIAVIEDISDKKQAQFSLKKQLDFQQVLMDTIPMPIFYKGQDGVYQGFNAAYPDFLGKSSEEILGKSVYDIAPEEYAEVYDQADRALFETGGVQIYETKMQDGTGQDRDVRVYKATYGDPGEHTAGLIGTLVDQTEQKQTERKLDQSFKSLSAILNSMDSLVYIADMETYELLFVNDYGRNVFGDVQGKICWEGLQEGQTGPCDFCTNGRLLDSEGNSTGVLVWEFQNTVNQRWYECRDQAIRWFDGRLVRMEIATDITERHWMDDSLRTAAEGVSGEVGEAFFESLVRYLAATLKADFAFIGELDPDDVTQVQTIAVWAKGQKTDNFTYKLAGTPCANVMEGGACVYDRRVQSLFPEDTLLVEMGVESYVGTPLFDASGNALGILVVLDSMPLLEPDTARWLLQIFALRAAAELQRQKTEDAVRNMNRELEQRVLERTRELQSEVQERKLAEAGLRESEERFRNLIEGSIQGILIHRDRKPLFVNHAYAEIMGYDSPDEILAKDSIEEHIAPHERERLKQYREARGRGELAPILYEYEGLRKDGSRVMLDNLVRMITWKGEPAVQVTVVDVTERRDAEERARQHQAELAHVGRLSTMGEMATTLAHELNQPLYAIDTYSQASLRMLRSGRENPHTLVHALEQTSGQAQRASRIIRRIREFVRKDEPKREAVDINELVRITTELTQPESRNLGVPIELDLADNLKEIQVNEIQIEQVVLNLMRNGLEAMADDAKDGVRLTVRTAVNGGNVVQVTVEDAGPGMDEEERVKIFEPFYTTKDDGMGMGLSICRSIIEAHAGRLWAESGKNGGTRMHFTLPQQGD